MILHKKITEDLAKELKITFESITNESFGELFATMLMDGPTRKEILLTPKDGKTELLRVNVGSLANEIKVTLKDGRVITREIWNDVEPGKKSDAYNKFIEEMAGYVEKVK